MNERERLEQEIESLKHELSVTIPEEIQIASEQGDLRENTEFSSAVARQHFIGIRLKQLVERLNAYKSVDINKIPKDSIGLGSIVKARHLESKSLVHFKIVMNSISDTTDDKYIEVTLKSPIGKALYNKKVKDEVSVSLPLGHATYRILGITTIHDLQ